MSERFNEQVSQFIDDEMTIDECQFFVRRLERDEGARACFQRYQLIGTVLRREHEPVRQALAATRGESARYSRGAGADGGAAPTWSQVRLGAGLAASMALVALVGFGLVRMGGDADPAAMTADSIDEDFDALADVQSTFPPEAEATGIQYLIHHTGYSSGLPRTIMRSGFVAAPVVNSGPDTGVDPLE